ncbi:MAG: copper resistance protein B [Porphyrobacter sp.]|nr:copper resistance protein B [Porphyrobacter sp.]
MRRLLLATAALAATPAAAQDHAAHAQHQPPAAPQQEPAPPPASHGATGQDATQPMDHAAMGHSAAGPGAQAADAPASGPPPRAFEGPEHAADTIYGAAAMAPAREQVARENGGFTTGTIMFDRLEARVAGGEDRYLWDAQGWYGGDYDRLWLKSEGEGAFDGEVESAEMQALWSHAIGPFFDLQGGLRYDLEPDSRAHAVLGLQGLAPYMFEVDAAAFLSDEGDLTARMEAEYDQRITQRLILQPRVEVALAAQDIPDRGIGAGISSVETGLRLRYEFAREFAPYVGVGYEARLGETADRARAAGEDPDRFSLLLGLRAWF